jgi:hypothetical protein
MPAVRREGAIDAELLGIDPQLNPSVVISAERCPADFTFGTPNVSSA